MNGTNTVYIIIDGNLTTLFVSCMRRKTNAYLTSSLVVCLGRNIVYHDDDWVERSVHIIIIKVFNIMMVMIIIIMMIMIFKTVVSVDDCTYIFTDAHARSYNKILS